MKRVLASVALLAAVFPLLAADVAVAKKPSEMTPEELRARRERMETKRLKHTGGRLVKPNSQKGSIVFANCGTSLTNAVSQVRDELGAQLRYNIKSVVIKETATPDNAIKLRKEVGGTICVFLVDAKGSQNTIGIYPEQRYAIVNTAAIGGDELRAKKELMRAFAFVCGAANSQYDGTLMAPVGVPFDIDTLNPDGIPYDALNRMKKYLEFFEVTPEVTTTYRRACEEGWAPAPTNDFQKAIWKEIHELPSAPLKLEK